MKPNPVHRLPGPLEAAVQSLKLAARESTERTVESLGLAALGASSANQRDSLLGAQFELNRKSAVFALAFNDAFDERVVREVAPRPGAVPGAGPAATSWDALSLVDDREVEAQISAERFALEIAHACEWELRELNAYIGSLLGYSGSEQERNPLRPEVVGQAMIRGIEAVTDQAELRKVLATEMGRTLANILRGTYARIVDGLRNAGVQPQGLSVRTTGQRTAGGPATGFGNSSRVGGLEDPASGYAASQHGSRAGPLDSRLGGTRSGVPGFGNSARPGMGTPLGQVDAGLMHLIRRLAFSDAGLGAATYPGEMGHSGGASLGSVWNEGATAPGAPLPNLIRANRDVLRQAATGSIDHMVIDVIGSLFDQILSDPKVPPQMARQIARLQLPVLRAALGDPSFFSSRRHPVRRFVNRIASLGAAFEDYTEESAQRFLVKVRALVQEVVEGDFDQIEVYERKVAELEAFVAEQALKEVQAQGNAADVLSAKEDELRLRQLYAQRLEGELKGLAAPAFVRDFISHVWSVVLIRAAQRGGLGGDLVQRMRRVGRELFMSVQPKPTPAQRKVFLAELPKLMQELTEGMNLIAWPEAQRREFFGRLMPAHAESLRSTGIQQLDINLMSRQVEGVLDRPLPSRGDLDAARASLPVLTEEILLPQFSAEEARSVGLIDEASVDWNGRVDIEIGIDPMEAAEAQEAASGASLPGLPVVTDVAEATEGAALADSVQIGFAYRMHLEGSWQKVRLAHVSDARSFFVFTRGSKHKQTISLTRRMLVRMCEGGRLRSFESAYLLDRATARARRQLSGLGSGAASGTGAAALASRPTVPRS
jgi:hypothetical protein